MNAEFYTVLFYSLLATSGVALLIIAYKYMLHRLTGEEHRKSYIQIELPDQNRIKGIYFFRIQANAPVQIHLNIQDQEGKILVVLADNQNLSGNENIRFDSTVFPDGEYALSLKSPNQEIFRKFQIRNI